MNNTILALAMVCAGAGQATAQTNATAVTPARSTATTPAEPQPRPEWSFSAAAYGYVVPDGREFVQPTFTADRGALHLEARYNYEDLDTGSLWVGYKFAGGEKVEWEITPTLGGVFGNTTGIAPGYKGSVSWWKLELYSEGEYVVDVGESSDSFFYNWSELSIAPLDKFRVGIVTQRTRVYHTDRDIQRGFLVGASLERVNFTGYVFNPDDDPTFVFAVGFNF